jgi:hypothetical protein
MLPVPHNPTNAVQPWPHKTAMASLSDVAACDYMVCCRHIACAPRTCEATIASLILPMAVDVPVPTTTALQRPEVTWVPCAHTTQPGTAAQQHVGWHNGYSAVDHADHTTARLKQGVSMNMHTGRFHGQLIPAAP